LDVVDVIDVVESVIYDPDWGFGAALASASAPMITMPARALMAKSLTVMTTLRSRCAS
jgi:hypothetical protein